MSVLGTGSIGVVYRAHDQDIDVDVALKAVAPKLLQTPEEQKIFSQKIAKARDLHHANIVRIYDDTRDGERHFFTMQLLEGLTLRKIIELRYRKRQPFVAEEIQPIFQQLVTAFEYAHRTTYHGDLKPENIIILPDLLKLTDFGLIQALPLKPFLAMQKAKGSAFHYLAPEVKLEASRIDSRADIYSLGVILMEMLTGEVFTGLLDRGFNARCEELPERVVVLIRKAMADKQESRYQTVGELFDALEDVMALEQLQGLTPAAPEPPPPPPPTDDDDLDEPVMISGRNVVLLEDEARATEDARGVTATERPVVPPRTLPEEVTEEMAPEALASYRQETAAGGSDQEAVEPTGDRQRDRAKVSDAKTPAQAETSAQVETPAPVETPEQVETSEQLDTPEQVETPEPRERIGIHDELTALAPLGEVDKTEPPEQRLSIVPPPLAPVVPPTPAKRRRALGPIIAICLFLCAIAIVVLYQRTRRADEVHDRIVRATLDDRIPTQPFPEIATDLSVDGGTDDSTSAARGESTAEPDAGVRQRVREDAAVATVEVKRPDPEVQPRPRQPVDNVTAELNRAERERQTEARRQREQLRAEEARLREAERKQLEQTRRAEREQQKELAKKQREQERQRLEEEERQRVAEERERQVAAAAAKRGPVETKVAAAGPDLKCPRGMAQVPSGSFKMGSAANDSMRNFGEKRLEAVEIESYCIDYYEYPNGKRVLPLANVTWHQAKASCEARGKRLCSEEEWEKACKGPGNLRYPYGNQWNPDACNTEDAEGNDRAVSEPVNFKRCRSKYGPLNLSGNVAEWTSSSVEAGKQAKVYKGGAANRPNWAARCANRESSAPSSKDAMLGFRCCANPE